MAGDSSSWIKKEVSLGNLLIIGTSLAGLIVWGVTASGRADQAGKDLQEFQVRMQQRFDGVDKRLGEIDAKTIVIPTQGQRVEQLTKQHDDDMLRLNAMERRQGDMERLFAGFVATTTAQLDSVMHPSLPPIRQTR